jgi:hypothetical protein
MAVDVLARSERCHFHPDIVLICLHADPISPPGVGEGGGTHRYLREVLKLLAQTSTPHLLLTRRMAVNLAEEESVSPCGRLVRLNIGLPGKMDKRLLDDHHETTVNCIAEALARHGTPRLLHSVYWNSGRAAAEVSRRLGIPFVHTVISNGWRRLEAGYRDQPPQRIEIERQVFHSAARIFCICGQERDDLTSFYEVEPQRISVVGRPVARPFLIPCHNGYGEPQVLSAAISLREQHAL